MINAKTTAVRRQSPPPGFCRRNISILSTAALLAVVAGVVGAAWITRDAVLEQQVSTIGALQKQVTAAQSARYRQTENDVMISLGFSRIRMDKDVEIIRSLITTVFTWNSGTSYEHARTTLKQRYGITEHDPFLKIFMPPSRYNQDAAGTRYYYIDAQGLHSSVDGDPDIEITRATAGDYTYAVEVDVQTASDAVTQHTPDQAARANSRRMLLTLTVSAARRVSSLAGTPASARTRHSR
ncbi:hypothetical protein [Amycolatopsis sp. PS_44_ISF1]|uniref:hypothetical protein n=1 Tax=Amycolatopsis sp. PS_44_ISF1 TaxID=2974917 RepID=UPI0028DD6A61|nr:hypothetical protein [Amycolatopsis sp. PS_44_ISF1]MDT8913569.1 hypothetical protein [Amycolatopsis sp. PS_44_ISF1]